MKRTYYVIGLMTVFVLCLSFIYFKWNRKSGDITVAEVTHSVFYAPFYVSLENGYFSDEGIDVDVILTSGADKVASAVLSGDAEIGLSGLEATLYVKQNGESDYLVNFSALTKRDGQFLVGSCDYKDSFSLGELRGKSVLAGRSGGMPSMVFNYALYKNGIDGVIIDNSVDFASLSGAYIGGSGDFVNLFEPTALYIEKEGYGCVLDSVGLIGGELPYTVFHTRKSFLEDNKDLIKRFVKAIQKGLDYVHSHSALETANVIRNQFPDTDILDLEKVIKRYIDADSWWDSTVIEMSAYNNLLDLMEYNDALDSRISYEEIVVNSFDE